MAPLSCLSRPFKFNALSVSEVSMYFSDRSIKTTGRSPDNLHLAHIKQLLQQLLPYITKLYNLIITSGEYPALWKKAFIVPLNKISKPASPSDTRPITGLCHLAKILDKALTDQIKHYLSINRVIVKYQSGFRADDSTQTALIELTDRIRLGIEHGLVTLMLCFDMRRAFDSIDHASLLSALRGLNFSHEALKLVHSYITGRKQAVISEDGSMSEYLDATSGVPQGSAPGPIFFIMLFNSLPSFLDHCKDSYSLFADDLQIFLQCRPNLILTAIAEISSEANRVAAWASSLGLSLNHQKSKAMIFGNASNVTFLDSCVIPKVTVDNEVIEYASSHKILGVILESNLTWNAHISSVSSKVHGTLYKLRQRGWLLSTEIKTTLVRALPHRILPHIDYACVVYNCIPAYLNLKVQRLVNAAIRFIYGLRRDTSVAKYKRDLKWISVSARRQYFLGCVAFKALITGKPEYLHERLSSLFSDVRRSERLLSPCINIPSCSTAAGESSFLVAAGELWVGLPLSIRKIDNLPDFKSALQGYLVYREFES